MSRIVKNKELLSNHINYDNIHVGGNKGKIDNSNNYVTQNRNIISNNTNVEQKVPQSYEMPYKLMDVNFDNTGAYYTDDSRDQQAGFNYKNTANIAKAEESRYDPITGHLFKKGLIDRDNKTKFNISYINIDSSTRSTQPYSQTDNIIKLDINPLSFNYDRINLKYIMKIKYSEASDFSIGDKITMNGVKGKTITLRTKSDKFNSQLPFQFTNGFQYLKIYYDSLNAINIDDGGLDDVDYNVFNGIYTGVKWTDADQSKLYINISGFQGTSKNNQYIGNIPINALNKRHRVYLTIPSVNFDNKIMYIKLPQPFYDPNNKNGVYSFQTTYNIRLDFDYILGVSTNDINAQYPIDSEHSQGYHIISNIDNEGIYTIIYDYPGSFTRSFGGDNVSISKITNIIPYYPSSNKYRIQLDHVYNNIIQISIVSSEFPYVNKLIYQNVNDTFYWENIEDGGYIYKITVESGSYTQRQFSKLLESLIGSVDRVTQNNGSYDNKNYMTFDLNESTGKATIKSYKKANLSRPITKIQNTMDINQNNQIIVHIKHANHGLNVSDTITITGAIENLGLHAKYINGTHTISTIESSDIYTITIKNVNYVPNNDNTGGGDDFVVMVPNIFRLHFEYNNTFGKILGFRDVGKPVAITRYNSTITNFDLYESESVNVPVTNQSVSFSGYKYFLLRSEQFKIINDVKTETLNAFGKIQLKGSVGDIMYDTFVDIQLNFDSPISQLDNIDVSIITPNGNLYDFNNLDHSYTIKIVTLNDKPRATGVSSNNGKIL